MLSEWSHIFFKNLMKISKDTGVCRSRCLLVLQRLNYMKFIRAGKYISNFMSSTAHGVDIDWILLLCGNGVVWILSLKDCKSHSLFILNWSLYLKFMIEIEIAM